jgi:multidrug resistance protein, MATE family
MLSPEFRRELRQLFALALPIAAAQAGTQLMTLVDLAVLGRLGAREIAAAGLANAIFFALAVVGVGISFGVDPLISQAIGAGDHLRARSILWQGTWLALAVSGALMIVMFLAPLALRPFGVQPELIRPATTYLWIRAIGVAPYLVFLVVRSYLQAHHITRPMILSMLAANVLNLGGDIVLVFGGRVLPEWTGPLRNIPPMGVAGAAIATVACSFLQLAIVMVAVRDVDAGGHVDRRWNRRDIGQAFRLGLPLGLQLGAEIGIFAFVGVLAGRLGTLDLAAHQLVLGIASFTYTVALGVSSAGAVRVGIAIGARDVEATRRAGNAAFLGGGLWMIVAALLFAIFPREISRLFSNQENVIAVAIPLFFVAAVFQLSDGIQAVGSGVLRGAGDTRYSFVSNVLGHWLIGFPVAMVLGFTMKMGIVGMWWGLCAGLSVVAVLLFLRFRKLAATEIAPL